MSQNTNNDFGIIYEQEIRMLDPKESRYINVLKVEIKEKTEKLRKGKLDIILITFLMLASLNTRDEKSLICMWLNLHCFVWVSFAMEVEYKVTRSFLFQ